MLSAYSLFGQVKQLAYRAPISSGGTDSQVPVDLCCKATLSIRRDQFSGNNYGLFIRE
jgi:hypothetical protein